MGAHITDVIPPFNPATNRLKDDSFIEAMVYKRLEEI